MSKYSRSGLLVLAESALFIALAILFSAYFVVMNSSIFILYSFVIFVALSVALIRERMSGFALGVSMALIYASSMIYMQGFPSIALPYSACAAFAVAAMAYLAFSGKMQRTYAALVAAGALLPILFLALNFQRFQALSINVAILGYYLLISVVMGLFWRIVYFQNEASLERKAQLALRGLDRHSLRIRHTAAAFCAILMILPIWPLGTIVHLGVMPYANVTLSGFAPENGAHGPAPYAVYVNMSRYSGIVNPEYGNVRFYYSNGTPIAAGVFQSANRTNNTAKFLLYLGGGSNGTTIRMYFEAYGTGFSKNLTQFSQERAANVTAKALYAVYGRITNTGAYVNRSVLYYGKEWGSRTESYNITTDGYETPQMVCTPGTHKVTTLTISADVPVSVIGIYNTTDFSEAVTGTTPYLGAQGYASALAARGYGSVMESRNATMNLSYNSECTYYVVVSAGTARVNEHVSSTYYANFSGYKDVRVPISISNSSTYEYFSYGFFPQGFVHLVHTYLNETAVNTGV